MLKVITELSGSAMTAIGKCNAWLSGVDLGTGASFYGRTIMRSSSQGEARFGPGCVFRSARGANLIGLDRPCMISIHGRGRLTVGAKCGFSGTVIGCFERIDIGDEVRCGANTTITDADWHLDDFRVGPPRPIVIEDHVWIGVGAMILKGVRIGRNTVIGAGSIVTHDIPADVIAAGNPCRVIRALPPKVIDNGQPEAPSAHITAGPAATGPARRCDKNQ